jgi:hypothetical protein
MCYKINGDQTTLDITCALGNFTECLEREDITGRFDKYRYCAANGRQVLLGHHNGLDGIEPGHVIEVHLLRRGESKGVANSVFISKGLNYHRQVDSWEELRRFMKEGWIIGTERHPGLKICFADKGRNYRRRANRIFVI